MSSVGQLQVESRKAQLSRIALGCSRVGSFNNMTPQREVRLTLESALDLGVSTFDTSNVYGQGDSEREIGRALRKRRDEAFVITKLGKSFSRKMQLLRPFKPLLKPLMSAKAQDAVASRRGSEISTVFRPAAFAASIEGSLRRLGFDHVDGLLLHSPSAASLRDPELRAAFVRLKTEGKVLHIGASCDDAAALDAALDWPELSLLQLPIDLIEQMSPSAAERIGHRDVGVLAREVIRLQRDLPPAEAIARASRHPLVDSVIVGTSRLAHLKDAAAAVQRP
ncbi:aldo/keto reductase [Phenylobacterium sp. LjRoot225]|uniref:aldo/keto reductase n=1 Tax=Phenylobacterium sp. LjRoot225 TaxID=3342285 RepID=UPI003ED1608A